ncbi:MAG: DNA recombination protein RmuC, partial [Phycisphaerae bacterium]|nr:DNA recombination protein RmuC [Phycisphaerae bacterium]
TIVLGLRGLQVEQQAERIIARLGQMRQQFDRFNESFRSLGSHLEHAASRYDQADRQLTRFSERLTESLHSEGALPGLLEEPKAAHLEGPAPSGPGLPEWVGLPGHDGAPPSDTAEASPTVQLAAAPEPESPPSQPALAFVPPPESNVAAHPERGTPASGVDRPAPGPIAPAEGGRSTAEGGYATLPEPPVDPLKELAAEVLKLRAEPVAAPAAASSVPPAGPSPTNIVVHNENLLSSRERARRPVVAPESPAQVELKLTAPEPSPPEAKKPPADSKPAILQPSSHRPGKRRRRR